MAINAPHAKLRRVLYSLKRTKCESHLLDHLYLKLAANVAEDQILHLTVLNWFAKSFASSYADEALFNDDVDLYNGLERIELLYATIANKL